MPSPFLQAGGQSNKAPKYVPIFTNRFFTGLWTQRNPLRDAATTYLFEKFYAGARFESLIAGSNCELSNRLTLWRRPGHLVYNSQTFSAIDAFYSFRTFGTSNEQIFVMADTSSFVYNATGPSTKQTVFTKSVGAGQAYFQGVGNTLYMGDNVDQLKWVQSLLSWSVGGTFNLGQYLIDSNGNLQLVTTAGTSGGIIPTWNVTLHGTTSDGSVVWTNEGSPTQQWGIKAPVAAPILASPSLVLTSGLRFWAAGKLLPLNYTIIDSNGDVQWVQNNGGGTGVTFTSQPHWNTATNGVTFEGNGQIAWVNGGPAGSPWQASTAYNATNQNPSVILDSNGNYQLVTGAGTSGTATPAWNVTIGGNTTDNTVTWKNIGNGQQASFGVYSYCYSYANDVTGGVSTASLIATLPVTVGNGGVFSEGITGARSTDNQVGHVWLFRSTINGSVPFFLASIANPSGGTWSYTDTSVDSALNLFLAAPLSDSNDPPPTGLINLTYHLGRVWGSAGNVVYYSGGPDTIVGNGNETFPPANNFVFPSKVTRLWPNGTSGMLVFTVSDVYVIGGTGTASNPFYAVPFLTNLGLSSYNAFDVNGSIIYMMTADGQVVEFNPNTGVSEIGFPIGDQFNANYNPANAYLAWHVAGSLDKALFAADGSTGWYRMNPTSAPESGISWSPFATIVGGVKAVQSVEVTPGVKKLLLGPTSSGPILKRDLNTFTDNGSAYTWSATIGNIVLAQPGDLAEMSFITTQCTGVGSHPSPSIMIDEIGSPGTFSPLSAFTPDPPQLATSASYFSDRFYMSQNALPALCQNLQLEIAFPAEAFRNEILTYTIFGRHLSDR